MNINNKIKKYAFVDGLVVLAANSIGVFLPSFFDPTYNSSSDYGVWIQFIESHRHLVNFLTVVCFIIPLILCNLYITPRDESKKTERFVGIPLVFSLLGSIGWLINLFTESIFLFYVKYVSGISILTVFSNSLIYLILSALFVFTFSFFVLETIHRKFYLHKFFPDGHLNRLTLKFKPTIRILSLIVYISTAIFPLFILISIYIETEGAVYSRLLLVGIMVFLGIIVQSAFTKYISVPVKKLINGAEKIKLGDLNTHVNFVSSDDFGQLADTFNDMTESLLEKSNRIEAIQNSIIKGMATMVESRDNSTGGHINRTSAYVKLFVNHLIKINKFPELSQKFYEDMIKAAPMHDLGKIAVDDAILRKPGKFTDEEYEIMKTHSAEGARIVKEVLKESDDEQFKGIAVNVAHYHHEKWNGTGYPDGLKKTEIPVEARIMALADVYDALVSKRCYKDQFSFEKGFSIIEESLGTHFDPELGIEFLKCRPQLEELTRVLTE